jgi:hypothetical protein
LLNFQGVVLLPPSQEEKAEAAATATAPVLLGQFRNERCCIRCEEVRHRIKIGLIGAKVRKEDKKTFGTRNFFPVKHTDLFSKSNERTMGVGFVNSSFGYGSLDP